MFCVVLPYDYVICIKNSKTIIEPVTLRAKAVTVYMFNIVMDELNKANNATYMKFDMLVESY